MAKSSTRNQQRRAQYDAKAAQARKQQPKGSQTQAAGSVDTKTILKDLEKFKPPGRRNKQRPAQRQTTACTTVQSPPRRIPATPPAQSQPTVGVPVKAPTPLVLAKKVVEQPIETPGERCAFRSCKERNDICSIDRVAECFAQQAQRQAFEHFLS